MGILSSQLAGIAINSNGISQVPGSPYSLDANPFWGFFASSGFIYTTPPYSTMWQNDFTAWQIDPSSGALTNSGKVHIDGFPSLIDNAAGYLYLSPSSGKRELYGYRINPQDGTLSELSGSPFPDDTDWQGAFITQDGTWACFTYFAGPGVAGGPIACQQRDPSSGALLSNTVNGPQGNYSILGMLQGHSLLAMNYTGRLVDPDGLLDTLLITNSGVQVTSETNIGSPSGMVSAVPDMAGDLVVASNYGTGELMLYQFDANAGALNKLVAQQGVPEPQSIIFTADDNFLVECEFAPPQYAIEVFSVSKTALTLVPGSPVSASDCTYMTPGLLQQVP